MAERDWSSDVCSSDLGEISVGFYVIEEGRAKVTMNGEDVGQLGPGDHFGEIALIAETPRAATVTADTDLRCHGMTSWDFRSLVERNGEIAWEMLSSIARKLYENAERERERDRAAAGGTEPPRHSGRAHCTQADETDRHLLPLPYAHAMDIRVRHASTQRERWLVPPRLLTATDADDNRRASWLELFFDLVFVVAITELSHQLVADHSAGGYLRFAALVFPVYVACQGYMAYATRFDTDDLGFRAAPDSLLQQRLRGRSRAVVGVTRVRHTTLEVRRLGDRRGRRARACRRAAPALRARRGSAPPEARAAGAATRADRRAFPFRATAPGRGAEQRTLRAASLRRRAERHRRRPTHAAGASRRPRLHVPSGTPGYRPGGRHRRGRRSSPRSRVSLAAAPTVSTPRHASRPTRRFRARASRP